jgi:hypothetical protein
MGVGKTTLIEKGVSKVLDLPFFAIPLGGAQDDEKYSENKEAETPVKEIEVCSSSVPDISIASEESKLEARVNNHGPSLVEEIISHDADDIQVCYFFIPRRPR